MNVRIRMACLCVGLVAAAASSVEAQTSVEAGLPSPTVLGRYGLERAWETHAVINSTRDRVMHLVIDEETVYVQTQNGFITALDAETGERRWMQLPGRVDIPALPVVSNSDTVLVASGINLYSIDKWTGDQLWEIQLPEQASSSPSIDETQVYIGTQTGSVFAFDLGKIYTYYQENKLPQWSYQTRVWRHRTSASISVPPLVIDDRVVISSETGTTYCVRANNHKLMFMFQTDKPITAPMTSADGYLYVATGDQHLYCLSATKGTTLWDFVARGPIENKPLIIDGDCYATPRGGMLYSINALTGIENWKEPAARGFVAKTSSYVFTSDALGNLMLLQPSGDGVQTVAKLPLRHFSVRAENELTDRVYLATTSGQVVCLREIGAKFPRYLKNPNRRPLEPFFTPEGGSSEAEEGDTTDTEPQTN